MSLPSQSRILRRSLTALGLIVALGMAFTAVSTVFGVPIMVATKTDTLIVDVDGDNAADPGDTLRYTTYITNTGSTDAGAIIFNDTIDANTTLVAGSLRTTPIARNDQYASLGNVGITVPNASGVLLNDNDPDGQTVSVIAAAGGTANGGAFSIDSDGGFSYLPPPGFEGADSFTYTIQDSDGNQDPATVFVNLNEVIWFIDNSLSSSGIGGLSSPFNSISAFNSIAADEAGDVIFLYSGSGSYSSGLTLLNSQTLIGQGASASIASIAGITVPPHSNTLPATGGTRPTIASTSSRDVTLGSGNTVRGLNINQAFSEGIFGNNVGNLTISEVGIAGRTQALTIIGGGQVNITLDQVQVTNAGTIGFSLQNITGGTTNLSNVDITTTFIGLLVRNANTINVTGSGNTIVSTNGGGLIIDNTTIGASNITFESISAANSNDSGIFLQNTGSSGSFSVTGTGAANSGGTLSGHSAEGVFLNNATNISLTDMVINQSATGNTQGIDATNVTNLMLVRNTITAGTGNSYALLGNTIRNLTATSTIFDGGGGTVPIIDGVRITNLLGTNTLANSTFRNGKDINLLIENSTATNVYPGMPDSLTISGGIFSNSGGGDHLQVEADGSANLKLVVNASGAGNSTFSGTGQDGMQLEAEGNATLQAIVTGSTFNNTLGSAVNLAAVVNGRLIARIHNLSNLTSSGTNVINMINFDTSTIEATIENNTITSATAGNGIRVIQEGNGTITANLANNNIQGVTQGSGILVQGRAGTGGNGRINATLSNNFVRTTTALALDGIEVTSGSSAGGDTNTICLNMLNNDSASSAYDGYFLRHRTGSTFQLQNFAGPATSAGITTWVNTTKSNTGSVFVSDAGGFTGASSACATPTVPVASLPDSLRDSLHLVYGDSPLTPPAALVAETTTPAGLIVAENDGARRLSLSKQTAVNALSGETINVALGTLNPGQVVLITFDVTIDDPQNPVTNSQVCNQGTLSGGNFADILTDDPSVGGASDPTCTPLPPGTIIIAKDQLPNGADSFGFTSDLPGFASFNVDGGSSQTINNVAPGSYAVTENDPSASFFTLTGLSCDDGGSAAPSTTDLGTRTATVNVESGETVTCTFTNQLQASIEVAKVIDFGGLAPNNDTFDLLIDGSIEASGVGDGDSTGPIGVALGSHTVSETGINLVNYNIDIGCVEQNSQFELAFATGASITTGNLNPGDNVLCTITNTHKTGSLEVVKNLEPASDSGSFDMRIDATAHVATGGDGTTTGEQTVLVGTHLVSETGDGATSLTDYTVSISCLDNDGAGSAVTATPNGSNAWDVDVNEGDDIVCTITNQLNGMINIIKAATPEDDTIFSFSHDIDGGGSFDLQDPSDNTESFSNVAPGSYTVSEDTLPGGWSLADIDCTEDQAANSTEDDANQRALITLDPGENLTCTFTNLFNQPPVINDGDLALDAASIDENDNVTLSGSFTDPDSGDSHTVTIDWGDGSSDTVLALSGDARSFSTSHQYMDDNPTGTTADNYNISVTVEDAEGESDTATTAVTVNNVAPTLGAIIAPVDPVNVADQPISVTAVFTDPGTLDTHTAVWTWGDGSSDTITSASSPLSGSHTYAEAGVYTVSLSVTDDDTGSDTAVYEFIVVYDPAGGFVTGGGWIDSLASACPDFCNDAEGRANFGFVAKYKKGKQTPDGNTQFQFQAGNLNFHSDNYNWLVINQVGSRAQFKGTGAINGSAAPTGDDYHFMIWATDGGKGGSSDTFRIKIWYQDGGEIIVYDNGTDQLLGGGNITVHTKK